MTMIMNLTRLQLASLDPFSYGPISLYYHVSNTPYSKMATILLFFYSYVNWPSMPRSHLQNSKEFLSGIEASRANLHEFKRIIKL